jgi:hypothetical protein
MIMMMTPSRINALLSWKRLTMIKKLTGGKRFLGERGIALAMILVLSGIALAIMAGLVYMLTASSQVSGIQKRYRTALEAGEGGIDVMFKLIQVRGDSTALPALQAFSLPASAAGCLTAKLNSSTTAWPAGCNTSISIDPSTPSTYDMYFELGTTNTYKVYSKIVTTVEGNSGGDAGLLKTGTVNTGEIPVVSKPYLYELEVEAEAKTNPLERGKYSILYQY